MFSKVTLGNIEFAEHEIWLFHFFAQAWFCHSDKESKVRASQELKNQIFLNELKSEERKIFIYDVLKWYKSDTKGFVYIDKIS